MAELKQKSHTLTSHNTSRRCIYIFGDNYKYVLEIQGRYHKKGIKLGVARVIDIIITDVRLKGLIPPYAEMDEDGARGSCVYTIEGENLSFLIDAKNKYKSSPQRKKGWIGVKQTINSIITYARKK